MGYSVRLFYGAFGVCSECAMTDICKVHIVFMAVPECLVSFLRIMDSSLFIYQVLGGDGG